MTEVIQICGVPNGEMPRHSVYPPGQPIVLRQADNQEMAREETKYRVHHQYGGVREVYDSRPLAIPKSTLVRVLMD